MTSRCDTICARAPGGDWQCPLAVPLQGGSTLSPQPGAPDSWDCTGNGNRPQGKAQVGTQETFQTCLRDAANKLRGPKDSQSFWEQQKPALVVQSDPAQEFPLCLCCDGEQTLYRSTRVRALLVPLISKQGRFSGFTAPPTPKWASGGPGVLHTSESHS